MNADELRSRIRKALGPAAQNSEIRVQKQASGDFRVAVVSEEFGNRSFRERRKLVDLQDHPFDLLDLLTPEERQWAGRLPEDEEQVKRPFWSDALEAPEAEEIVFPSDLDEDLDPPIVATFYSLRGGVGRSSALAYTGMILAQRGHRVVCVDMDLEAPGLAALFGHEDKVETNIGTVPLLVALEQGEKPDFSKHLLRVSDDHDLYCIPAGHPDAHYARQLNLIDPNQWYREERNPLRALIEGLQEKLPFRPDILLLDSRTGITPLSGPLLFDLADLAMVVFFPHPQAKAGTGALVRALLAARSRRPPIGDDGKFLTPEPRFIVSPIPAVRVAEVDRRYRTRALDWIQEWLAPAERHRSEETVLIPSEITQFIPYRETLAASDRVQADQREHEDYQPIADWIEGLLPTEQEEVVEATAFEDRKPSILEEIRFPTGTAEQQEDFLDTFVETEVVRQALRPDTPLVLGRKGTGKTAIFRRLMEGSETRGVVVTAPAALRGHQAWKVTKEGYQQLERVSQDWSRIWRALICLSTYAAWSRGAPPAPPSGLSLDLNPENRSELNLVETSQGIFGHEHGGLLLSEWMERLDQAAPAQTLLLFDGLDTGFGTTPEDRQRRQKSLEGLFSLFTEVGEGMKNLRFKVMLREDIWRQLRFDNKSHLHGRSARLHWSNQIDFLRVALRQALRSREFRSYLQKELSGGRSLVKEGVSMWSEKEVLQVWTVLVGERMKGGKTAFTRNWVWNRLADGNGDHSPRYLLQLFHSATRWERDEHRRNPYGRSVIRPRSLIEVLPDVSEAAVSAVRDEEFQELEPLLSELEKIGQTPLEAKRLQGERLESLVDLALEVGLLEIYEGTEEQVVRYRVPELYRHGLKLSRKGQA